MTMPCAAQVLVSPTGPSDVRTLYEMLYNSSPTKRTFPTPCIPGHSIRDPSTGATPCAGDDREDRDDRGEVADPGAVRVEVGWVSDGDGSTKNATEENIASGRPDEEDAAPMLGNSLEDAAEDAMVVAPRAPRRVWGSLVELARKSTRKVLGGGSRTLAHLHKYSLMFTYRHLHT